MWYGNIYELVDSSWNLDKLAKIENIFDGDVEVHPRLITNGCPGCTAEEKKNFCV
jgi:hypothetical protein